MRRRAPRARPTRSAEAPTTGAGGEHHRPCRVADHDDVTDLDATRLVDRPRIGERVEQRDVGGQRRRPRRHEPQAECGRAPAGARPGRSSPLASAGWSGRHLSPWRSTSRRFFLPVRTSQNRSERADPVTARPGRSRERHSRRTHRPAIPAPGLAVRANTRPIRRPSRAPSRLPPRQREVRQPCDRIAVHVLQRELASRPRTWRHFVGPRQAGRLTVNEPRHVERERLLRGAAPRGGRPPGLERLDLLPRELRERSAGTSRRRGRRPAPSTGRTRTASCGSRSSQTESPASR